MKTRFRISNGVLFSVCSFALGAACATALVTYSLTHDLTVGKLRFRYFNDEAITRAFHKQYASDWWHLTAQNTQWRGVPTMQTPLDMWVFQEIFHETKPDVLVETGTNRGGGAYYYASMFDLENKGRILTVDIEDYPDKPKHDRISYLTGSSTDKSIVEKIKESIKPEDRVMVILDSDHEKGHVLREMAAYAPLVCKGCYLVVQDTHLNGNPISLEFTPGPGKEGPMQAVKEFLASNKDFEVDHSREKFGLTYNPGGWLKRVQ